MPYSIRRFQPTPNPAAVKCIVDRKLAPGPGPGGSGLRSYASAGEASGDPLASRLLAIEGVSNILISTDSITIGKRPEAEWGPIRSAVERVLREAD